MSSLRRLVRVLLTLSAGLALLGLVTLSVVYALLVPSLPSVEVLQDVQLQVPLRVYTRDGRPVAVFGEQRRIPVSMDEIPEQLRHAFLAAEDDRFYQHPGVDWRGILRAAWYLALTGEKGQGGSTITMQLARNFFLEHERTYVYKLKQILLALKIEREFPKQRIFELYLNKIYLGHRAYGVAAAAQVYYGKSLFDLTLAETAMIASLPKAPSSINPITSPDRAVERRNYVLSRMRELNFISEAAYREALATPDHASPHGTVSEVEAPYLAEMARQEAVDRYGDQAYTGGYEIYTTVDSRLQTAANKALRDAVDAYDHRHGYRGPEARVDLPATPAPEEVAQALQNYRPIAGMQPGLVLDAGKDSAEVALPDGRHISLDLAAVAWARPYLNVDAVGKKPEAVSDALSPGDIIRVRPGKRNGDWQLAQLPDVQGALVAVDPFDGAVRALAGGYDYDLSKFNRVTQARRQPGSSFKPFIYSAALDKGFTAATLVNDAPVVFDDPSLERTWRPENFSQQFFGPTRLREALVHSRNLVSIRVLNSIGIDYAIHYLPRFGFDPDRLPHGLSLALGTAVESPLEMARGFATFANGGFRVNPYYIERIVSAGDDFGYEAYPAVACLECDTPVNPAVAQSDTGGPPLVGTDGADPGELSMPPDHEGAEGLTLAPRVIDPANAYIIDSMMEDVIRRGTGRKAKVLGRNDLSGKTGTTNDQVDAWFSGFQHSIVTTAWVGFDQPKPLGRREVGAIAALPMWIDFMRVALEGQPARDLPMPPGVVTVRIDPETGKRAQAGDPDAILELFREGHVPPLSDKQTDKEDQDQSNPYDVY